MLKLESRKETQQNAMQKINAKCNLRFGFNSIFTFCVLNTFGAFGLVWFGFVFSLNNMESPDLCIFGKAKCIKATQLKHAFPSNMCRILKYKPNSAQLSSKEGMCFSN